MNWSMLAPMLAGWVLGLAPQSAGDEPKARELFQQGRYAEAAVAFRAELRARPDDAELLYNLALALWRAGQIDAAETAAEQAATLSGGRLNALRDGILGNLRFDASKQVEAQDLQKALALAQGARDHYQRGAAREGAPEELARNLERALQRIEELEKKIEEQKKEEQEKKDEEKKDDKKDEQQKPESQPQSQPQSQPESQPQSQPQQEPEQKPESQPQDEQKQPQPQDQKQDQQDEKEQKDAKEQPAQQKELTPEQKQRLLDLLEKLEQERVRLREAQKAARPKVERDW